MLLLASVNLLGVYDNDDDDDAFVPVFFVDLNFLQYCTMEIVHEQINFVEEHSIVTLSVEYCCNWRMGATVVGGVIIVVVAVAAIVAFVGIAEFFGAIDLRLQSINLRYSNRMALDEFVARDRYDTVTVIVRPRLIRCCNNL